MQVTELTRDQLTQLKQNYYCQKNENVSMSELASVDDLVSDDEIFEAYGGTTFVDDNFVGV